MLLDHITENKANQWAVWAVYTTKADDCCEKTY